MKKNIHTISVLVSNKPGVLVRCAQVFARRGFNIDALVVSPAVNPKFSRMTITLDGDPEALEQIIKQTAKLIDVVHCQEHSGQDSVDHEYAMLKIKTTPKTRPAIIKLIKGQATILNEVGTALIVGCGGDTSAVDDLESKLKKFGIIEMVRSGKLVMAKGQEET
ncbi:MAG: acetolactate synthase small subunit [Candidatus Omnitrophota bacterium]|jgi:acetolactate synthase small subunit